MQVYSALMRYSFEVMCKLFMSVTDPGFISRITDHFHVFGKGLLEIPLNIPGTRFCRAMRAADALRAELRVLVSQRRALQQQQEGQAADLPMQDLLSCLLKNTDEDGKLATEEEVANNILGFLFAAYGTSTSTMALLVKYLAEQPRVHEKVLRG